MEGPRSDSLNELVTNFSEEELARLKEHVEKRARATAPATVAPLRSPLHENWYVPALDRNGVTRP